MELIKVSKRHIKLGKKASPYDCAIALAICDHTEYRYAVIVRNNTASIGYHCNICLPRSARRFITKFDKNKKDCKPFNFKLDI